jgi:hypothetical protein
MVLLKRNPADQKGNLKLSKPIKNKRFICVHDRDSNQWFLVQSFKNTPEGKRAINPIEITDDINPIIGDMGDYVRRVENMCFNLINETMIAKRINQTEENFNKLLNEYDAQANEQLHKLYTLYVRKNKKGRYEFATRDVIKI